MPLEQPDKSLPIKQEKLYDVKNDLVRKMYGDAKGSQLPPRHERLQRYQTAVETSVDFDIAKNPLVPLKSAQKLSELLKQAKELNEVAQGWDERDQNWRKKKGGQPQHALVVLAEQHENMVIEKVSEIQKVFSEIQKAYKEVKDHQEQALQPFVKTQLDISKQSKEFAASSESMRKALKEHQNLDNAISSEEVIKNLKKISSDCIDEVGSYRKQLENAKKSIDKLPGFSHLKDFNSPDGLNEYEITFDKYRKQIVDLENKFSDLSKYAKWLQENPVVAGFINHQIEATKKMVDLPNVTAHLLASTKAADHVKSILQQRDAIKDIVDKPKLADFVINVPTNVTKSILADSSTAQKFLDNAQKILDKPEDAQKILGQPMNEIAQHTMDYAKHYDQHIKEILKNPSEAQYILDKLKSLQYNQEQLAQYKEAVQLTAASPQFTEEILKNPQDVQDIIDTLQFLERKGNVYDTLNNIIRKPTVLEAFQGMQDPNSKTVETILNDFDNQISNIKQKQTEFQRTLGEISDNLFIERPPEVERSKDEWQADRNRFLYRQEDKRAVLLDFDGTLSLFTEHAHETVAVQGVAESIEQLLDKGIKVAIITGRPLEGENGILAALKRSGFEKELTNRLYISASQGVEYIEPGTDGEIKIKEDAKEFMPESKELLEKISDTIQKNELLRNDFMQNKIKVEYKKLGATIHYVRATDTKSAETNLRDILETEVQSSNFNFHSAVDSFEVFLDAGKATNSNGEKVAVNKGTAAETLVNLWKLDSVLSLGDDTTDTNTQKKQNSLTASGILKYDLFMGVGRKGQPRADQKKTPSAIKHDSAVFVSGPYEAVEHLKWTSKEISPYSDGEGAS